MQDNVGLTDVIQAFVWCAKILIRAAAFPCSSIASGLLFLSLQFSVLWSQVRGRTGKAQRIRCPIDSYDELAIYCMYYKSSRGLRLCRTIGFSPTLRKSITASASSLFPGSNWKHQYPSPDLRHVPPDGTRSTRYIFCGRGTAILLAGTGRRVAKYPVKTRRPVSPV